MKSNKNLKTVSNFAEMHGLTKSYIYRLIRDKKMNCVTIDGVKFIDISIYKTIS